VAAAAALLPRQELAHLGPATPVSFLVLITAVRGVALGLTVQTPFTAALADVPHEALPRATSLVASTRYLVQAFGVAVLATLLGGHVAGEAQVTLSGLERAYLLTFALAIAGMGLGVMLPGWPGSWHRPAIEEAALAA